MKTRTDFKEFYELLEEKENFLLTSHQDPDGDSIGSLIGLNYFLKDLGKRTVVYNQGRLPNKYEFLDPAGDIWFTPQPAEFNPEAAIILECPSIDRIGFVKDFIASDMILVNIDHHNGNSLFGDINYIDESACAVAEILYHIIKLGGYKITPEIAGAFYAGIASDTGRFKSVSYTHLRAHETRHDLVCRLLLEKKKITDISVYARQKGGGGHPNAAGFTLNKPLNEAVTQTIAEVTEFLNG